MPDLTMTTHRQLLIDFQNISEAAPDQARPDRNHPGVLVLPTCRIQSRRAPQSISILSGYTASFAPGTQLCRFPSLQIRSSPWCNICRGSHRRLARCNDCKYTQPRVSAPFRHCHPQPGSVSMITAQPAAHACDTPTSGPWSPSSHEAVDSGSDLQVPCGASQSSQPSDTDSSQVASARSCPLFWWLEVSTAALLDVTFSTWKQQVGRPQQEKKTNCVCSA